MVEISAGTFKCILRTPTREMINCRARSVIIPAADGMLGILRNHEPVLSTLTMGIVQVRDIHGRNNAFFLVNGGFLRFSENHLMLLSDDVTTFEGMSEEQARDALSKAKSIVVGGAYISTQTGEEYDLQRAKLMVRMGEMAQISVGE